jgi:hypothetical protein
VNGERAYHGAIKVSSLTFAVIGVVLLVVTLANGGGPLAIGFLMGILFLVVGVGRYWIASRLQ